VRGLKNIPPTATRDRRCLYYFALRERPLNGEPIIIAGNGDACKQMQPPRRQEEEPEIYLLYLGVLGVLAVEFRYWN
jgi:hypothetical protein